jgi:hypothetical protein
MKKIDCFIPYASAKQVKVTLGSLRESALVSKIYLMTSDNNAADVEGCTVVKVDSLVSSDTMQKVAKLAEADYTLFYTKYNNLMLGYFALDRFVRLAGDTGAGLLYADSYSVADGNQVCTPVIDYQFGSLRDDFNFGSVIFFDTAKFKEAAAGIDVKYKSAGFYDLRLRLSRIADFVHINEYLYSDVTIDTRKSGEKIFDYVDPKNRGVQIEMEQACTAHLKAIGGYLEPKFDEIDFSADEFKCEASVIIPVRNRIRTIRDAINSVLSQKASFDFNVIIIDNHSTDGTSQAIDEYLGNPRVIHIVPERNDLGIGGCWNVGVQHPACGKFAVQLDSDDVYSSEDTLARIVNAFYEQKCAMVVGTYQLTDFDKNPIPPGIIDHKEWTPENGRNNALRVNGLGAPRAFYTPMLRNLHVPNTSYGEDYALGLAFSRHHQIGRIYDVLYLCRRWEDNSDASLDVVKVNNNNLYKDRIRTWELQARCAMNKAK